MGTYRFKLPDIGEGVVEAEITAWHVAPGETVEEDQPLADAMTDKATIELTSPVDGVVRTVACEEGEMVAVGADLVVFDTDGEEAEAHPAASADSPSPEPAVKAASGGQGTYDFKLPDIGEGVVEAEITAWHVAVGDSVEEDDPLADAMTDKATIELTSPVSGTVTMVAGDEGDTISVGATLVSFAVEGIGNTEPEPEKPSPAPVAGTSRDVTDKPTKAPAIKAEDRPIVNRPLAAPAVRKRARDAGLDLSQARATGSQGQVTHADLDLLETALEPAPGETRIKVIGLRRKIAQSMAESKRTIAHFTYVDEIDVTDLEALRKRANAKFADAISAGERPKLTVLPFIIRALAMTLKDWPQFNARYHDDLGHISQFSDINLGIATQTDIGLVVPVIQQAQTLSIWDMAREIARLANGARDNQLKPSDFQGATTTLTSLGPLGGIVTTPVVNKPEVAIFGPNKIRPKLELRDGAVVERMVMNFSVSCDHRVIDGYDAASMIQELKARLQDPIEMFLA
ncbi:2-oxo acid dehydrogenase subunit E2 [Algimonas porphyrae]|uniref:Dihydrolipoamide acetyltransferase component of pyruvate dehydrogenase complex n=1 Tax=Algimonas porphyrae TaxID=1128113 RepID=A0ABQ5UZG2_9PROT|nr:2-oxo acid dehydrogenase subunit E2 [Algimonas porphyrae]GLQ19761.1 lipoamide acyltransferase component of branched-chain alpha-keto acid dehydrogenase complex [Algimonas porphyrae]